jgi:hypothetical protein
MTADPIGDGSAVDPTGGVKSAVPRPPIRPIQARVNESATRVVKIYARDLAIGDVIVRPDRATWDGVVFSVPEIGVPESWMVSFDWYDGEKVVLRSVRDTYVMRVLQGRRTQ